MKKERKLLRVADLQLNEGQLGWLPKNPRQWTQEDIDKTAASIDEDKDFLEERPILVIPIPGTGDFVVFCGNLRREGAKAAGLVKVPCVVHYPETEDDREAVLRRSLKDNGSFGRFDWDEMANSPVWGKFDAASFGIPSWNADKDADWEKNGLSSKGREGAEGYDEFVNKFDVEQPLTTDDCYTPPEVFEVVRNFVNDKVASLEGREIVRPFFPGGDYEHHNYPAGCVVIDNPPFSLYSQIVRFYLARGIDFFLFGPALSLIVSDAPCTFIVTACSVRYENGAQVSTGFVTNMCGDVRIWVEPTLRQLIQKAQETEPTNTVYDLPDEVCTSATIQKIARGEELKIMGDECQYIHNLDKMKEDGRGLFGGGFLLSRAAAEKARAAAEKARAAAEKARAAAEKARAIKIELSDREKAIVEQLNKRHE